MQEILIIKFGGSIITDKSSHKLIVHSALLHDIAKDLYRYITENPLAQFIIIHGAGGPGHHLAHQFDLANGTNHDPIKIRAVCNTRLVNQKLNTAICDIFLENDIPVIPAHTGALITQENKKIITCNIPIIQSILESKCIPVLYGDMVHDTLLEYSVCSGDTSAAYLAQNLPVKKVFFATDVDGIFDKDPHTFQDAKLVPQISLQDVFSDATISIEKSHNTDVTGGLKGKLAAFQPFIDHSNILEEIVIFNGTNQNNYYDILSGSKKTSTHITL